MDLQRIDIREYAEALPDSGVEVFHDPDALSAVDDHTPGELRIFGGFKGQRAVGLLPTFVRETPVGRSVVSPPPGMGVPRLGPVLDPASPKRRKRERVNRRFAEGVLDHYDGRGTVFRLLTGPDFPDPRPYEWNGLSARPAYTYRVDADRDPDELLASFSKSLRREIRDARDLPVSVDREGVRGARRVFESVRDRYDRQGEPFALEWPYVENLFERLGPRARAYVLRDGSGRFLCGITTLYSADAAYFWQGGTKTVHEGVDVNALLHWRILREIREDPPLGSVREYDLMGANTERLCRYKAKFGGRLAGYHVIESSSPLLSAAKRAYQMSRRRPGFLNVT